MDDEESLSEGFSPSEEEWTPHSKVTGHGRGRGYDGESSDYDDSDFEVPHKTIVTSIASNSKVIKKKNEIKSRNVKKIKATVTTPTIKKRKSPGKTLRAKLYNKYRPPPKTISLPSNSPMASTSSTTITKLVSASTQSNKNDASKNLKTPNASDFNKSNTYNEDGFSSDSSSSEFCKSSETLECFHNLSPKNVNEKNNSSKSSGASTPIFNCNAGLENLDDSESETNSSILKPYIKTDTDDNITKKRKVNAKSSTALELEIEEINTVKSVDKIEEEKDQEETADGEKYDFTNLLQNLNNIKCTENDIAKFNEWTSSTPQLKKLRTRNTQATDVLNMLALGENLQKQQQQHDDGEDEDNEEDDEDDNKPKNSTFNDNENISKSRQSKTKLNKTKSIRIKRNIKGRPDSIAAQTDSDDSEWEDVADNGVNILEESFNRTRNLEIVVELPKYQRKKDGKTKTQQDLELALKRKFNRDRKERQLLMHKASLLCHFVHYYLYNRFLNDIKLIEKTLKLLPSQNAYPSEKGTEMKYFQAMAKWFTTVIKLETNKTTTNNNIKLYTRRQFQHLIMKQINERKAISKQHMIYILVILLRGMGLHCRLIVNLQPIALKPPPGDLISIQLKTVNNKENNNRTHEKKSLEKEHIETKKNKNKIGQLKPKKMYETVVKTPKTSNTTEKSIKNSKGKRIQVNLSMNRNDGQTKLISESTELVAADGAKNDIINKYKQSHSRKYIKSETSKCETIVSDFSDMKNDNNGIKSETTITTKSSIWQRRLQSKNSKNDALSNETTRIAEENNSSSTAFTINSELNNLNKKIMDGNAKKKGQTKGGNIAAANTKLQLDTQEKSAENAIVNSNKKTKAAISSTVNMERGRGRVLRSRVLNTKANITEHKSIPQLDGADDENFCNDIETTTVKIKSKQMEQAKQITQKRPNLIKLKTNKSNEIKSDDEFEPPQTKKMKIATNLKRCNNRLVLSPDCDAKKDANEENEKLNDNLDIKRKRIANDVWLEVWCDLEEQWMCLDIFSNKVHCIESITKSASNNLAYVYAFQNDLSAKDVTARYCANWIDVVRKGRVDKNWLDTAFSRYIGQRTMRDIKEDQELRRIHEEKPMPTTICDYKNHPFYALERHLLKFEAIYPPNAPTLGYVRNEAVYSRDCVHTLHSREIWLKEARVVKLGEKPYKIVKARPKWDRFTQTVIKDQPLEIFGYWQTQDYEPPTAENGLVPRNAYGNVELFKPIMLPKKTKHIRLPGLNRICKKLGIDCANAVIGFDFHQGVCHPMFDGFVVCEEFADQVTAAWYQDQEEQERKEQEKWETRIYGNWKKLIRGLLIRERLKLKYNF